MMFRLFCLLFCLFATAAFANNVQVKNVQAPGPDRISFSISWQNNWNLTGVSAPYNYDAVWVFIKYRAANTNAAWQHLNLSVLADNHAAGATLAVETVADGKGVFLKRKATGKGNITEETIVLYWGAYLPAGSYDFKVFAIEMVWVPQESFWVGDGASQSRFRRGDTDAPFHIRAEQKMLVGKDSFMLNDTGKFAPVADIPAAYPKGYKGFYCMKYEISQQQYVDFLNCLNYSQQQNRTAVSPASATGTAAMFGFAANRNGIIVVQPGEAFSTPAIYGNNATADAAFNATDDGQHRACNFLNWADVAAYLDWAALRPLTEFEFEKVCRGPLYPNRSEFAWGTAKVTDANTVTNDGSNTEGVTEKGTDSIGLASHGYSGPQGPLRTGFAATASTNRAGAGAAFYGVMEMSGNLWEMVVTVNAKGLEYTGLYGDGNLTENGEADVVSWPSADGNGAGYRGGAWNSGIIPEFRDLAISDRFYAGLPPVIRRNTNGGRGCR